MIGLVDECGSIVDLKAKLSGAGAKAKRFVTPIVTIISASKPGNQNEAPSTRSSSPGGDEGEKSHRDDTSFIRIVTIEVPPS
jgi:hypothetical protein